MKKGGQFIHILVRHPFPFGFGEFLDFFIYRGILPKSLEAKCD
jgi:hypothetical protein